ncbi:hypothetical protein B0A50_02854 [Salinomyces thailandicus]|uniref:Uncharacterized protein n=1 Tax=Salinomyces thailandicus TaxID=706561 RepID=A0A4U0U7D6_9PEZI|nr:hypothetical protein B0A50_02854 [Salinomyces thailandica]
MMDDSRPVGTLAEWLTRCPAKAVPSGASDGRMLAIYLRGRRPKHQRMKKATTMNEIDGRTSLGFEVA